LGRIVAATDHSIELCRAAGREVEAMARCIADRDDRFTDVSRAESGGLPMAGAST
jgi:hypothetical protein